MRSGVWFTVNCWQAVEECMPHFSTIPVLRVIKVNSLKMFFTFWSKR